jgi:hypothetical protein
MHDRKQAFNDVAFFLAVFTGIGVTLTYNRLLGPMYSLLRYICGTCWWCEKTRHRVFNMVFRNFSVLVSILLSNIGKGTGDTFGAISHRFSSLFKGKECMGARVWIIERSRIRML